MKNLTAKNARPKLMTQKLFSSGMAAKPSEQQIGQPFMTSMNSRVIDLYHSNRSGTPGRTAPNLFLNQQVTQTQQSEVLFLAPVSHTLSEPHQVEEEEEKVSEEQNDILNIVD